MTPREEIIQVVNKLFVYTDRQDWESLQNAVFSEYVLFDVTSLGAEQVDLLKASEICEMWQTGFEGIDHIHHQAGTYLVDINGKKASVDAYAIASHYKKETAQGHVRTFVGSYKFGLEYTAAGWRINLFTYQLKYIDGNIELV